mmetsp:Transcript_19322/g.31646  ORF Transcript_19322/g.31646 Transcript_19322/m.31646 type:complete len:205 (+) Transcript_19322:218-832(+)
MTACLRQREIFIDTDIKPRFQEHPYYALFIDKYYYTSGAGISEILPGLIFLGSARSAKDDALLFTKKIKGVLTIADELRLPTDTYQRMGIAHKLFSIPDLESSQIREVFDEAFDWLNKVEKPVLIHCAAGISRSATVTIAYLMKSRQMSLAEAWTMVKNSRPIIYPNKGFIAALMRYEAELYGSNVSIPPEMLDCHTDPTLVEL